MEVFNFKFVGEVEKHPVIYNNTLQGYSRKDVTEKAWKMVAKEVNLSVNECKEKWRNLRSTLAKNLKPTPSRSGAGKKKEYYLKDAMQFTIPFIKGAGTISGNLPPVPQHINQSSTSPTPDESSEEAQQDDFSDQADHFDSQLDLQSNASVTSPSLPTFPPPLTPEPPEPSVTGRNGRKMKRQAWQNDADEAFANYFATKAARMTSRSPTRNSLKRESIQNFLNSLLPDLMSLTDFQLRHYKIKALSLVDEAMNTYPQGVNCSETGIIPPAPQRATPASHHVPSSNPIHVPCSSSSSAVKDEPPEHSEYPHNSSNDDKL